MDIQLDKMERWWAKTTSFGVKSRVRIYNRLWRFTSRGYSLDTALGGMYGRLEAKKDPRRTIWREWVQGLREGKRYSLMISEFVPPAERVMIAAGENTGRLDQGFKMAGYTAESIQRIQAAIKGALFKPGLLIAMFMVVTLFTAYKMVPTMLTIAPKVQEWPFIARSLHAYAMFIQGFGVYLMVGFIAAAIAILKTMPKWTGRTRSWLDRKLPPWTVYRQFQGASLLITLSALVQAGNPIDVSLKQIRRISPPWLSSHLDKAIQAMAEGRKPAIAIDTGLLDAETMGDLTDYDNAGAFSDAIEAVGTEVVEDTIERVTRTSNLIGAAVMFMVAGGIVWVYAAMMFLVMDAQQKAQMTGSM